MFVIFVASYIYLDTKKISTKSGHQSGFTLEAGGSIYIGSSCKRISCDDNDDSKEYIGYAQVPQPP